MLGNFVHKICGAAHDWRMASFVDEAIAAIRRQVGDTCVRRRAGVLRPSRLTRVATARM